MVRATVYILLAAFLRLQAASCCHDELCLCPSPPEAPQEALSRHSSCSCQHEHALPGEASSVRSPIVAEVSYPRDSRNGRHLCVIAHLRFLGSRTATPLNLLLAVNSHHSTSGVFDVWPTTTFDRSPSASTEWRSLLECGSLLRV